MDGQATSIDLFKQQLKKRKDEIEAALEHFLPKSSRQANELCDAVRYSVLNGGKRVRPLLTILVAEMLEGDSREAVIAASAIEMIHSYSLVHDDLPCLDNDDIRRGRPTCHKKFGEYLGFAFQIVDDILDGDGYLKHMSLHEAREKAADLVLKAKQELHHFDRNTSLLCLADSILERGSSEN